MSNERRTSVHRRRRIILNDDSGVMNDPVAQTEAGFLSRPLCHIPDTGIDSVWWSIMTGADHLKYDSKVGDAAGKQPIPGAPKGDLKRFATLWRNFEAFIDRGADPLKFVVEWGHGHGREVFASYRMNMIQDSWRPTFGTRFRREHPDCCLGERGAFENSDNEDLRLCWSALDYEHEAVRDYRFAILEELCHYDIDGVELDFWRWPAFFKPTLDRKPVEGRHLDAMTDFMRRVRGRMMEIESERGRPLLLAAHLFDTPEINRRLGLDVETWLEEGLLDILVIGGHYTNYSIPLSEWSDLARNYDLPLYPCMYRSTGVEFDRAIATHYYNCGADGIYTFNIRLPAHLQPMKEIGDPDLIARKDKHYVMDHAQDGGVLGNGCAPGLLPVRLEEGAPAEATLIIGDDVRKAAAENGLAEVRLRLSLTHFDPNRDEVAITLNGRELHRPRPVPTRNPWAKRGKAVGEWAGIEDRVRSLEFLLFTLYSDIPTAPDLTQGANAIEATLGPRVSGRTGPVDLVGLELFIRYQ